MVGSINKTPKILRELEEKEGVRIFNTTKDIQAFRKINEVMEEVRINSNRKQALSEISAKNVILD